MNEAERIVTCPRCDGWGQIWTYRKADGTHHPQSATFDIGPFSLPLTHYGGCNTNELRPCDWCGGTGRIAFRAVAREREEAQRGGR